MASTRYALGTAQADAQRQFDTLVSVPLPVPVGALHLVVEGKEADGRSLNYMLLLRGCLTEPLWALPLGVASVPLGVVGGVWLLV